MRRACRQERFLVKAWHTRDCIVVRYYLTGWEPKKLISPDYFLLWSPEMSPYQNNRFPAVVYGTCLLTRQKAAWAAWAGHIVI